LGQFYNCLKVTDGNFVLYLNRYSPVLGTTTALSPDHSSASQEQLVPDNISNQAMVSVWTADGPNSGRRRFGTDNLPITSAWFTGVETGSHIEIIDAREGILPNRVPFNHTTPVIPDSETNSWTVLAIFNGKQCQGYLTTQPMPQCAIDVCLITIVGGKRYIRLVRRGTNTKTVDMPGVLASGAGEHLEGGTSTPKQDIDRTLAEECGFNREDYGGSTTVYLKSYSDPDRDPRYTFINGVDPVTGTQVQWGERRGSSTDLYLVVVEFGGTTPPPIKEHSDVTEVQYTFWCELDEAIAKDPSEFFLKENHGYMQDAKNWLDLHGF
jgi:hypothetical protein